MYLFNKFSATIYSCFLFALPLKSQNKKCRSFVFQLNHYSFNLMQKNCDGGWVGLDLKTNWIMLQIYNSVQTNGR